MLAVLFEIFQVLKNVWLWKENLNSDSQQLHQYH